MSLNIYTYKVLFLFGISVNLFIYFLFCLYKSVFCLFPFYKWNQVLKTKVNYFYSLIEVIGIFPKMYAIVFKFPDQ